MGEFDFIDGRVCYYDEAEKTYKPLMPITEATLIEATPSVDDIKVFIPPISAGELEGTMTITNGSELYWIITHGYEKLRLYNYLDIQYGTDRRRIKRHKRRIRMFKIKQKIAKARGQV